jgi:serine phosphatase RsbU (regulator of sigma subunit)
VSDRPTSVGSLLRATPPDRLPEALVARLRDSYGVAGAEILLSDLTMSGLWPVVDPEGPAGGSLEQRCFGSQQPLVDGHRVLLPLTVWGDRLGVLRVDTRQNATQNPGQRATQNPALNAAQNPAQTAALNPAQTAAPNAAQSAAQRTAQTAAERATQNPAQTAAQRATQNPAQTAAQRAPQNPALNAAQHTAQDPALNAPQTPDRALVAELTGIADELAMALRTAAHDTDRYRKVTRRQRLTMAAELQWDLLPGRSLSGERFRLAGALEPAYAMYGDHYDWSVTGDRLTLTVLNGHGDGIEAALITTVAVNAMRNARRSGAGIVEQAELASDAVYSRHGGTAYVATLLLEIDLSDGFVEAVDAGSPRAMIARQGEILPVTLDEQLPLGMFGDSRYETQKFQFQPGDRLLVVSDGVHGAAPEGRPPYGTSALLSSLRGTRLQPPTEAVGTVVRGLREYHGGADLEDDAVIVCLDWLR